MFLHKLLLKFKEFISLNPSRIPSMPFSHKYPNLLLIIIDSGPPHFVERTGNPHDIASSTTTPSVSKLLDKIKLVPSLINGFTYSSTSFLSTLYDAHIISWFLINSSSSETIIPPPEVVMILFPLKE